jgi:hypothetical protein
MYLDEKNVDWVRPKPLKWVNSNGKNKLYYPDFYLPKYDLFLDPKNPHCLVLDKEKMEVVSKKYKIIFGDVNYLINQLNEIINK